MKNKVWIVGVRDCESNSVVCICATKELAEKKLFEERDKLVKEWRELDRSTQKGITKYCREMLMPVYKDEMYKNMIENLKGDDYENWNNFPHDRPYLYEQEVLEE